MTSRWSDLERPPLSARRIERAVVGRGWSTVRVVDVTASTNADVVVELLDGATDVVVIAESQAAGRGRLGRTWSAPPRSSILLSAGIRLAVPESRWSLLPLLAGCAAAEAVSSVGGIEVGLKWPNDLLAGDGRKFGGILLERVGTTSGPAAVIGVGINVSLRTQELPVPTATSIGLAGGTTDREPLAVELLRALRRWLDQWQDTEGDSELLLRRYRASCVTIGRDVTLDLPGGSQLAGLAVDVDGQGRIVIDADGHRQAWSAGDVTHLRATGEH